MLLKMLLSCWARMLNALSLKVCFLPAGAVCVAQVYPTQNNPPPYIGEFKSFNRNTYLSPQTGTPAITVPMGFTAGGFPTGMMISARRYAEPVIFEVSPSPAGSLLRLMGSVRPHRRTPPNPVPVPLNLGRVPTPPHHLTPLSTPRRWPTATSSPRAPSTASRRPPSPSASPPCTAAA